MKDVYFVSKKLECLLLLLQDKMTREIVADLKIPKRTIETHINHIIES